MKKAQAVKFWKAVQESTEVQEVISAFANKKGYGGARTLERYVQAAAGFRDGASDETVAARTGWSPRYVCRIRDWWDDESSMVPNLNRAAPGQVSQAVPADVGGQPSAPEIIVRVPYGETPHKQKMRELAKDLRGRISFPSLHDKRLVDYTPVEFRKGEYQTLLGNVSIIWDQIEVGYYDVVSGMADPHLVEGLFSHLRTSGVPEFAEMAGDNGRITQWIVKAGLLSGALLRLLRAIVDDVTTYKARMSLGDELKPGLTRWFATMVWSDAFQRAGGYAWIDDRHWYRPEPPHLGSATGIWQLYCGAWVIGIAESPRRLKTYENWHKKARDKYAEHPLAREIALKDEELDDIAQEIRRRLAEFSDMQDLPGRCRLC